MSKNSTGVRPGKRNTSSCMSGDRLRAAPVVRQRDGGVDVTVGLPVRVEVRRLAGDADVVDQARDDLCVPFVRDELSAAEMSSVVMVLKV